MQNLLSKLNKQQREAVTYLGGPLLVIAGAGSGKTRVITTKIAYLIKEQNLAPKYITAITFTNKAANEMAERVNEALVGVDCRGLNVTTFHSLGLKILKQEATHLGYKKNFSLLDSADSAKIISDNLGTTDKSLIRDLQQKISLWKNALITPSQVLVTATEGLEFEHAKIYQIYQDTLKSYQAVDFDDLIKLPIELFETNMEALYRWQQKIKYLLIDEYQDTNECQYRLIKLLVARDKQFTAVGDDDQSIYAWRGANIQNIHNLNTDYPNLNVIKLEQNYRSTATILHAANHVIQNNPKVFDKKLWSEYGIGESIKIMACRDDEAEAEAVSRKIMMQHKLANAKFSDFAILYRSNHQARVIEQAFRNMQIPYTLSGGQSFFEKTEIKDIISYLRLMYNEDDDVAFIRALTTPKRGIGVGTIDKLSTYAKNRQISLFEAMFEEGFLQSIDESKAEILQEFGNFINNLQFRMDKDEVKPILDELVNTIHYEDYLYEYETSKMAEKKWGNVLQLISWLEKKSINDNKKLNELIQMINLISILDGQNKVEVDAVKLSTLHAAKGLEYPYVFLISCEEGILPHQESLSDEKLEEERRLMYVGITRAEKELNISYCEQRRAAGELRTTERSRFITEMGDNNIIDEKKRNQQKITDQGELSQRLSLLRQLLHKK